MKIASRLIQFDVGGFLFLFLKHISYQITVKCVFGDALEDYHGGFSSFSSTTVAFEEDCRESCYSILDCKYFATRRLSSSTECRLYTMESFGLMPATGYKLTKKYCNGLYECLFKN